MKPATSQSRNLRELDRARQGKERLATPGESPIWSLDSVLIGALAQLVSPELWDQALNTTYGYIASCQVKLKTWQEISGWYVKDEADEGWPILGYGTTEVAAKDDFWRQWKEKRDSESAAG